jgi:hypothetical protein
MSANTDRRRAIERLAYSMWEAAGRPHGDGLRFWLDAEREYAAYENPASSVDTTPKSDSTELDEEKKRLEVEALRRSAKTEYLRLFLTVVGAFAFIFGFLFDRYRVREQRQTDRRVAIVAEFDQLHARTNAALFKKHKNPVLLRLNVEAYRDRITNTEKQIAGGKLDQKKMAELRVFLAESRDLAERLLAEIPANTEFRQWSEAMDVEAVWQAKADSLAPDLAQLFGGHLAAEWGGVRDAALAAIRSEYSLCGTSSEAKEKTADYNSAAGEYQQKLYARLR